MSHLMNLELKYEVKAEIADDDEVCRLCAEKTSDYSSIFLDNLHESLSQAFGLSINSADNWPKAVCRKCMETAKICLDFLTIIRKAETIFQTIYGEVVESILLFKPDIEMINVKELSPDLDNAESLDCGVSSHETEDSDSKPILSRRKSMRTKRKQNKPVKVKKGPEKPLEVKTEEIPDQEEKEEERNSSKDQSERALRVRKREQRRQPSSSGATNTAGESTRKGRRSLDDLRNEDERIEQFFKLDCSICAESFTKWPDLRVHFKSAHKQDPYLMCCERKLGNRIAIITHLNGHTNPDAYKCLTCNKAFLNETRLNLHNLNKHIPVEQHKYKCPKCPKTFMILSSMNIHQAKHMTEDQKKFKCPHCLKAFAFNAMMRQHIRNIHQGGERFVCEICAKEIKGKHTYEIHVNNHKIKGVGDLSCPICEKKFKRKRLLKDHIDRHNPSGEVFKCDVCGRYAPNRFALKRHIENTHLDVRKYECTSCEGAFKTKIALREHTATHHGSFYALYTCLFCDKQFNSSSNRYVHQKQKHPVEYQEMRQRKLLKERGLHHLTHFAISLLFRLEGFLELILTIFLGLFQLLLLLLSLLLALLLCLLTLPGFFLILTTTTTTTTATAGFLRIFCFLRNFFLILLTCRRINFWDDFCRRNGHLGVLATLPQAVGVLNEGMTTLVAPLPSIPVRSPHSGVIIYQDILLVATTNNLLLLPFNHLPRS
uniref:Putative transcription factor grauzone isoform x1 n=1 Tax=Lutzomyia longipalpis TaxID=7200 RepID=A0A7G3AVU9_LUTLO